MKSLLLTFDYELFLGKRSGSVKKCLLEPTMKLQQILRSFGMTAVFFVDTTYLLLLEKQSKKHEKAARDFELITHQLQQLQREGHFLYPHIHPHWLDAKYLEQENQWNLSSIARYRFHLVSIPEREMLFSESNRILSEILKPSGVPYEFRAYRAGGWCIQPFDDFAPFFKKYGIKYDLSVLKGDKCESTLRYFDFSQTSSFPDIYRFSSSITEQDLNGEISEVCISMLDGTDFIGDFSSRVFMKLLPENFKRSIGDGLSAEYKGSQFETELKEDQIGPVREMVSIELLTSISLNRYLDYFSKNEFMHFISHPKMVSPHNLETLKRFLTKVVSRFSVETDFKKICP